MTKNPPLLDEIRALRPTGDAGWARSTDGQRVLARALAAPAAPSTGRRAPRRLLVGGVASAGLMLAGGTAAAVVVLQADSPTQAGCYSALPDGGHDGGPRRAGGRGGCDRGMPPHLDCGGGGRRRRQPGLLHQLHRRAGCLPGSGRHGRRDGVRPDRLAGRSRLTPVIQRCPAAFSSRRHLFSVGAGGHAATCASGPTRAKRADGSSSRTSVSVRTCGTTRSTTRCRRGQPAGQTSSSGSTR